MGHRTGPWTTVLIVLLFFGCSCGTPPQMYDLLIKGGTVIDGSGSAGYKDDIGIIGERIAKIGRIKRSHARRVIDARGLIVTPGFIDVHTHCDRGIVEVPTVDNYLLQGVTTVIGGNCGGHPYPVSELFRNIEAAGISPNFGVLIGHNTLRREVMGLAMEPPTPDQMERMKILLDQEMRAGGLGLSTGLSYLPGTYSDTEELVELASAVKPYGGIYATHLRDQGEGITGAILEAIQIGESNGIPVQISHIKLSDDKVWGEPELIVGPVEEAQSRGVEVYLDQYPYTATSSGFTSSFPSWAFEGGQERFLERLEDETKLEAIKDYIRERRLSSTRGIDKLETIYIASFRADPEYQGKNLREILEGQGKESNVENAVQLIIDIQRRGGAQGVFFQMDEQDVEHLMRLEYNMHASDGGIQVPGRGVPHPRNYGTFPRIIAHFVRERGVLTLAEAVRKMTSLPARAFRIRDRGLLREGCYADLTVFDFQEFTDQSTFSQPHQYSRGLDYVLVNGQVVVEQNQHLGTLPGKVIYGPGKSKEESE
jgi:N-acyl-D-amino-acid deacylase